MPERLAGAVQQFTDDVGRLHTPLAVLVALQNLSHGMLGVEVLGAWILPRYFKDQAADWREGENLFFHPDVPRTFWPDYLKQYAEKGYSANDQGAANLCSVHFHRDRTRRICKPSQLDIRFLAQL
jgi:hypothetical protein